MKETAKAYREAVYAINQRLLYPENQIYYYEAEVNVVQLFFSGRGEGTGKESYGKQKFRSSTINAEVF